MNNDELNHIFQLYSDQELKRINFNLLNVTTPDRLIIGRALDPTLHVNLKLNTLLTRIAKYFESIRNYSLKAHTMNIRVRNSVDEDVLDLDTSLMYEKAYLSSLNYGYLKKPNSFQIKFNYAPLNRRFQPENRSVIQEDEISTGVEYSQRNSKKSAFLSNTMYFPSSLMELETKMKLSMSDNDIKRKQSGSAFKVRLARNFNDRPFLFRDLLLFDPINKFNLQYSHKVIKNYIDDYNCSPEMFSRLPQEDSQHHFKASYVNNSISRTEGFLGNTDFKASSSLVKTLNSTFLKSKVFHRQFFNLSPFVYQLNLEAGHVMPLKVDSEGLRIHERLFVNNFKGVVNPSPKALLEEGSI